MFDFPPPPGFPHPDDLPGPTYGMTPQQIAQLDAGCSPTVGCRCGQDCYDWPEPDDGPPVR